MKTGASVFLILTGFLVIASTAFTENPIFPVGLIVVEDFRDFDNGWPFDLSPEALVDLRSKGMEVIHLNGIYELAHPGHGGRIFFDWVMEDVDTLRRKLARADSFGFVAYGGVRAFDDALRRWGHDPIRSPTEPYFRWLFANRYSASAFRDTLDSLVSWVVDSLRSRLAEDDIRSLYGYFFWDEPFAKHVKYVKDTLNKWEYDDYWLNIWEYDDLTGLNTDSLSVGTLLKQKIEEKDTLRSVSFNLCGWYSAQQDSFGTNLYNAPRGLCALKCDGIPNPPHQYSFDKFVFRYDSIIGDTSLVRNHWCTPIVLLTRCLTV
jgi:hypothetical protein